MTPTELGERAKQLLAEPAMMAVFTDIRAKLVSRLESAPVGDIDTQHEIALMLQLLKQIKQQLEQYAAEVEIDAHRLKQDRWIDRMRQKLA